MTEEMFSKDEQEIVTRLTKGRAAEEFLKLNRDVLRQWEQIIFGQFASLNVLDNQKFDNTQFLVLHLKVKLIREFISMLGVLVSDGDVANDELKSTKLKRG